MNYAKLEVDGAIAHSDVCAQENAPVSRQQNKDTHLRYADDGTRAPVCWVGKESAAMTEKDCQNGKGDMSIMDKALGMALDAPPNQAIKVDVAKYQAWLDDPALSDQQREQIIEALWTIIMCFVDLGFGVSPLENACGEVAESEGSCGHPAQDVVDCQDHTLSETFNEVAAE